MNSTLSPTAGRILCVFAVLVCLIPAVAQRRGSRDIGPADNFNSPTPILLSEVGSTRALTQLPAREMRRPVRQRPAFPGATVKLYVTNLALMNGEGASAFRVYAEDRQGHLYRFPVVDLRPAPGVANVWAMTTILKDEIGYYAPPAANGDVLIYVTWRGLASNKTRLGLGRVGGGVPDDSSAKPTPIGTTAAAIAPETLPNARGSDRSRFMEQAGFGPTPATETQFGGIKLSRWIQNQFLLPYPSVSNPYPVIPLRATTAPDYCDGNTTVPDNPLNCYRDTYTQYPLQTWNSKEMLYGDNPLRHKVTWALSQIWVTSGVDLQQSRWMIEYHKILSNNAFGNYRSLMREMTLSPAMGEYLSMNVSTRTNPNENYAREIMQLFTIGLFMLNQDGTVQCYERNPCLAGDTPIPTYDQNIVNDLTRVFTGWTLCNTGCPNSVAGAPNYIDPMIMSSTTRHDTGPKTLLTYPGATGTNISACTNCTTLTTTQAYASSTMDQALDNIFNHPNVGPYISKILIQQMVTSDPTPAYVSRVAAAFNNNGIGVRGDMKAVIAAILLDREARGDVKTDPNYGKLREPVQFATGLLRALDVRDAAGTGQSDGVLTGSYNAMGQNPFRSPTVFNYYPPDFVIPGTALLGPEFALMTTGTTIQRANFVNTMAFSSILPSAATNSGGAPSGTSLYFGDLTSVSAADPTGNALLDELDRRMLHRTMSASMRSTILNAINGYSLTDLAKVRQAVYLVATSSQYQVQR